MADSEERTIAAAIRRIWTASGKARGFHYRGQFFLLRESQRPGPKGKFLPGVELVLGDRKERDGSVFWPRGSPQPPVSEVLSRALDLLVESVMRS